MGKKRKRKEGRKEMKGGREEGREGWRKESKHTIQLTSQDSGPKTPMKKKEEEEKS